MRFSHVRELYNEITTYCKYQLLTSEKAVCGHAYGNEKKKACNQTPAHRCNSNNFSFRVLVFWLVAMVSLMEQYLQYCIRHHIICMHIILYYKFFKYLI